MSILAWFWHTYIGQWILAGITVGLFVLLWAAIENPQQNRSPDRPG